MRRARTILNGSRALTSFGVLSSKSEFRCKPLVSSVPGSDEKQHFGSSRFFHKSFTLLFPSRCRDPLGLRLVRNVGLSYLTRVPFAFFLAIPFFQQSFYFWFGIAVGMDRFFSNQERIDGGWIHSDNLLSWYPCHQAG